MKCVVKVEGLGYYGDKDKPAWVASLRDARVFRTKRIAQGVVKVLRQNRIHNAKIERL